MTEATSTHATSTEPAAPAQDAVAAAEKATHAGLARRARQTLLTAHIALSVALLGDAAGYLAVAIRTRTLDDPALAHDSLKLLNMFSLLFGIPLSFAALLTGVALGLGTRWGVSAIPGPRSSSRSLSRSCSWVVSSSAPRAARCSTATATPRVA
jgi:hypothetical protein